MQIRPESGSDVLLTQLVNQMRRFGMGERVLKTALAAGVSWQLANWVPGNDHPYLAPVSALLLMQLTIAQSIDLAIQRNIGVAIGVCVAVAAYAVFGVHAWSIGLVILIALAGGIQLRLGQQALTQVAVSALLVLLAGSVSGTFEYAGYRVIDSLIGAAVALALNWLIVPPVHINPAIRAIEQMSQDLATALADLTVSLRTGMTAARIEEHLTTARAMAASLTDANAALDQAEQSLRYNWIARGKHQTLARLRAASRALEHSAIQTRVMCRSISTAYQEGAADWIDPATFGRELADLFGRNTALVRYVGGARAGVRPDLPSTDALQEAMRVYWTVRSDRGWLYAGEVLAVAERMAKELHLAIDSETVVP